MHKIDKLLNRCGSDGTRLNWESYRKDLYWVFTICKQDILHIKGVIPKGIEWLQWVGQQKITMSRTTKNNNMKFPCSKKKKYYIKKKKSSLPKKHFPFSFILGKIQQPQLSWSCTTPWRALFGLVIASD